MRQSTMVSRWRLLRGLQAVSQKDNLFYPLVSASLYIALGPWSLGYFLDEDLGLLFPWGLVIDGQVLPADVTHLYGLFFMFPYLFLLILALALKRRRKSEENNLLYWLKANVIFVLVMILQLLHCLEFY